MTEFAEYSYWGLFLASFLAATILPFSSEALLTLMLIGKHDFISCTIVASAGNWLGGMLSYYIGWIGKWKWIERFLGVKRSSIERLKSRLDQYGAYFALLTWLPFLGDSIAIGLGFFRVNALIVALCMFIGKVLRYIVLGWMVLEGMGE